MSLPVHTPLQGNANSSTSPVGKRPSRGAGCGGTFTTQTCRTGGIWGRVGYPPPGSQLYHARGGVQSGSRGWSDSTPHPCTHILDTGAATGVSGRITGKSGPTWGVGWGVPPPPGPPDPSRSGSGGASASTLPRPQIRTLGTPHSFTVTPKI